MTESHEHPIEPPGDGAEPAPPTGEPPAYGQPQPPPAYGQPQPPPAYGQPQGYPPPGGYVPGVAGAPSAMSPADERTWATAAHWSALVASLVGFSFLGPLLVMLIQGNKSAWVRRNAVESLNFQISLWIYLIVSAVLILVIVGIFLLPVVGIFGLVMTIMGAVKANNGEDFRYPLCIRMVS